MTSPINRSYSLVPHTGVTPLRFGMSRDEVIVRATEAGWQELEAARSDTRLMFYNGPAVHFGAHGAELFELAASADITAVYRGSNVFDVAAKELVAAITKHERSLGYMTEPIVTGDKPLADLLFCGEVIVATDAAKQYDYWGNHARAVFHTVGIGSKEYFEAVTGRAWVGPPRAQGEQRYIHPKLGMATLVGAQGDVLELRFDDGIVRKLKRTFVSPA